MNQRWWLLIERVQATLPLLAVAGLAGFTWWLVQSSPKEGGAVLPPLASSAPDYELQKARLVRFDAQGRLQAILDGIEMRHYPDKDRLVIDRLNLSARDEKGQGLKAVAREGEADRMAELVHLRGGVKVVALPASAAASAPDAPLRGGPVHFAGEGLRIDTRQRILSSDEPVLLTQAHSEVRAQSMVYNDQTRVAELGGRVHGRYVVTGPTR
ncbi:MAG: LPS export ABC transporter periplasmic protein LptC [Aquabacterium sp.]